MPITTRFPQLIEAFAFIQDEYVYAKLSWCSQTAYPQPAVKALRTITDAGEAPEIELISTAGTKPTTPVTCTCRTCTVNKWALALDELYASFFPEDESV